MQDRNHEIEKAKRYLDHCEDQVTASMHCDDATLREASKRLRQAQIRLHSLEMAEARK